MKYLSGLVNLSLFFFLLSCSSPLPQPSKEEIVEQLNGYWKIHQVKDYQGDLREYKVSTTLDYIEVNEDLEGTRRKVKPQLDSSFEVNNSVEKFHLEYRSDSVVFYYQTSIDDWQEVLLSLQKDEFKVRNEQGMEYTYKRFESLKKELESHEGEIE